MYGTCQIFHVQYPSGCFLDSSLFISSAALVINQLRCFQSNHTTYNCGRTTSGLSVVCTNEKMVVFLDFSNHGNLDLDKVTLKDANCKAPGPVNATHLSMDVPFDSCMTNHSTDGDTITYQNSLIAETRASAGSSLISREFQAEFPFKCTYPRSAVLSVVAFSPRERIVYTKTGNYTTENVLPLLKHSDSPGLSFSKHD